MFWARLDSGGQEQLQALDGRLDQEELEEFIAKEVNHQRRQYLRNLLRMYG